MQKILLFLMVIFLDVLFIFIYKMKLYLKYSIYFFGNDDKHFEKIFKKKLKNKINKIIKNI